MVVVEKKGEGFTLTDIEKKKTIQKIQSKHRLNAHVRYYITCSSPQQFSNSELLSTEIVQ